MPLLPPAQVFEHPSDLVIDVFGTYLGKRSERMIVRWRDEEGGDSPRPVAEPDRPFPAELATCDRDLRENAVTDVAAASADDQQLAAGVVAPDQGEQSDAAGTMASLSGHDQAEHGVPAVEDSAEARSFAEAQQITAQLLKIWEGANSGAAATPPSRFARLRRQLEEFAEPVTETDSGRVWREQAVPMSRLRSVTVAGRGVTVSSDLVNALVERGIALSFLNGRGEPIAQLIAPGLSGTVQTRRAQLAAYETSLGVQLAVEFIRGKLRNQKHQLQYSGKYLKSTDRDRFERLIKKVKAISAMRQQLSNFSANRLDDVRNKLMGYEGTAARLYWEGVAILLEGRAEFSHRITRGAIDPINSALNYGYGILYGQVSSAIANAGLELFAGFLHVDRPGKPALVLDLAEEFRAPVVDRSVLAIVNQGIAIETDSHGLRPGSRKLIAGRVLERLATSVPYEGKRWPLRNIIQNQARHLAVAVRGERDYCAFASRW